MQSKRTKGEWKTKTWNNKSIDVHITNCGGFRMQGICEIDGTNEESQANAEFICLAVNNFDAMLLHLKAYSATLDILILQLPTGDERNKICDENIKVKHILSSLEQK